jgi:hypothetical protein
VQPPATIGQRRSGTRYFWNLATAMKDCGLNHPKPSRAERRKQIDVRIQKHTESVPNVHDGNTINKICQAWDLVQQHSTPRLCSWRGCLRAPFKEGTSWCTLCLEDCGTRWIRIVKLPEVHMDQRQSRQNVQPKCKDRLTSL